MNPRYSEEEEQQEQEPRRRGWCFGGGRGLGGPRGFGGRHGHGHGRGRGRDGFGGDGEGPMKRLFGHGDLRFLLLSFLKEKPRHGYEIIKLLEEKSAGQYVPSPGVIYPTLTFLEEAGFAKAETVDNKKLFSITEAGETELKANQEFVDAILERIEAFGERMNGGDARGGRNPGLRNVMMELRKIIFSSMRASDETKAKIADILSSAVAEIKKL